MPLQISTYKIIIEKRIKFYSNFFWKRLISNKLGQYLSICRSWSCPGLFENPHRFQNLPPNDVPSKERSTGSTFYDREFKEIERPRNMFYCHSAVKMKTNIQGARTRRMHRRR